MTTLYTHYSPQ